jgi:hypothetical protein
VGSIHANSSSGGRKETYAEKLKLCKNEPVVLVRPKDSSKKGKDTRAAVQKNIDPSKLPIKELRNVARGSVVLECKNAESAELVRKGVEEKMGDEYEVSVSSLRNPEVKVIGLFDKPDESEVIERIKIQNEFLDPGAIIEILKVEKMRNREDSYNLVLKVDPKSYNLIMSAGRLNVGWNRCRVVENLRILRCFKCCEYGHRVSDCKNEEKCNKCAGCHNTNDCDCNGFKCVNCEKAKLTFKLNDIKTDHPVWSPECQVYSRILERKKKTINYYG